MTILDILAKVAVNSVSVVADVLLEDKWFCVIERRKIYMKVRRDFVTNSSSSSFLIAKKDLDVGQILAIKLHPWLGEKLGIPNSECSWCIEENNSYIAGFTSIDNFDMTEFLEKINVNMDKVVWSNYRIDLPEEDKIEFNNNLD